MAYEFELEDILDFSSDEGPMSSGVMETMLGQQNKLVGGKPVSTTASDAGYGGSTLSVLNAGQVLMGMPVYKDGGDAVAQHEYMMKNLLTGSLADPDSADASLGAGFDELVPEDVKADAAANKNTAALGSGGTPGTSDNTSIGTTGGDGMNVSTDAMRQAWAPPATCPLATYTFWSGVSVQIRAGTEGAWARLDAILKHFNYAPRKGVTGAFCARRITGGSGWSLHAYGIACDINWDKNPYGKKLVTDMPIEMVVGIESLRTNTGKQVFRWGGRYRTNKDAMHFEIICGPADIQSGIASEGGSNQTTAGNHRGGLNTQ